MRRGFIWAVATLFFACWDYPTKPDEEVTPKFKPPPVATGGGKGICPGTVVESPTYVLWMVRMDRSTSGLANTYANFVTEGERALKEAGFVIRDSAVGSLYDGSLLWSRSTSDGPALPTVLFHHAETAPTTVPTTCPALPLAWVLEDLRNASGVYPPALNSSTFSPFGVPAGALLVVVVDHGDRPAAWGDQNCSIAAGVDPAEYFGTDTSWLNRAAGGWQLSRLQTRFVFISSREGVSYADEREHCQRRGVPAAHLDAIEPSEFAFYGPFAHRLTTMAPGMATHLDLCSTVASGAQSTLKPFAKAWRAELEVLAK